MNNIEKTDKNFAVKSVLTRTDVKVHDVCDEPFKIYGLIKPECEGDCYRRIPKNVAETVSKGVYTLHTNTAGGRVRFATDSRYIAIRAILSDFMNAPHMPLTGSAGFDLYVNHNGIQKYLKTFIPPGDIKDGYESEIMLQGEGMKEYTLNFPLYSNVISLKIILEENARLEKCCDYSIETPIVYYGSSITQGGCASRPGNSYENIISRKIDCNYINLGFSGSAKAEKTIAEYIASLDMSAFVFDYDYNAPDCEYLKKTYEPMFKIIREHKKNLPIICISMPYGITENCEIRRAIIRETVENARKNGDNNVYFISGTEFGKVIDAGDSITVDGCHPNDLGFMCMAKVISDKLKKIAPFC